ncbi:MAG: phosphorylcholine transferase LicD [Lachnospiraceae bacterium]
MLRFPKEYFEGETRDGFYIEPFMKHAWAAQLEVLHKIDTICKEYDIPYFADWGTLLGTVRHKGIIPWDDDIDICMMRSDLEHFMNIVDTCQNELKCLSIYNDPNWGAHAIKVVNSTSVITEREKIRDYHGFPFTAGVDIFTIDYVPRNKKLEEEQYDVLSTISQACHLKEEMEEYLPTSKEYLQGVIMLRGFLDKIQNACQITFSQENPTEQELYILFEEVSSLYKDEDSDYLTQVACLGVGMDYYISKETYSDVILMPFETIMIPVPVGYDELLRKKYGPDYMVPQNKGAGHDYPFYGNLMSSFANAKYDGNVDAANEFIQEIGPKYYLNFLSREEQVSVAISEEYLADEFIDGVEITREKKQIWAAQIEVLEEIKRICKCNNLKIFAIGQTLSDAMAYGNYGPLSEDIHLAIGRKDYITFMNVIQKQLGEWFDYRSIYTNTSHEDLRCYILSAGLEDDEDKYKKRFHGCPYIVGVDISVLDAYEDNKSVAETRKMLIKGLLSTAKSVGSMPPYSNEELAIVEEWKNAVNIEISTKGNLRNEFFVTADRLTSVYREDSRYLYSGADVQASLDILYKRVWFKESVELPFSNTTIPVPIGYKEMLGE